MRQRETYIIVDCIPNHPKVPKGHFHNSRLSFELYTLGGTAIIDPGTYVYTADSVWRNCFRSTSYHNTIMVDDKEQNFIHPRLPFVFQGKASVKVIHWETTEILDVLEAEHDGYNDISVTHRRRFLFDKENEFCMIKDTISGSGIHKIDAFFHFEPYTKPHFHQELPTVVIVKLPKGNLALIPYPIDYLKAYIDNSWISYSYGTKVSTISVRYVVTDQLPKSFSFLLCSLTSDKDIYKKIDYIHTEHDNIH